MDFIHIEGLELDCIVGVRPWERRRPQRIVLDLALGLDSSRAGRSGRIVLTCDYDRVADEVQALFRFREYQLIEVATEELAALLFGVHPALSRVQIRLTKPAALPGRARGAAVSMQRDRGELDCRLVPMPFGDLEVLVETYEAGLYLLHVEPGRALELDPPPSGREHGFVVSGELCRGSASLSSGDILPFGPHPLGPPVNRAGARATVFYCSCPPRPGSSGGPI
jgi:FolB domain-containing protein